jgi:hypothetical protein
VTFKEKILFHQVHPAKLFTDVVASIVSLYFFWMHELWPGLAIHFIPPPVASALVLRYASLERIQDSRTGAYLVRFMTPAAQGARLVGDLITIFAAWLHAWIAIAVGFLLIIGAWSYGALLGSRPEDSPRP